MKPWFDLSSEDKKTIIEQTSAKTGLNPTAIEKDFWVTLALNALFKTQYSPHLVFKGGTSLSKAWGLIQRFSEDIDLALNRRFLGFEGDLTQSRVKKLRKKACAFVSNEFIQELNQCLLQMDAKGFEISVVQFEESDTDPIAIELKYESLTESIDYLRPRVLIEVSSRSLIDPFENKNIQSLIGQTYPTNDFSDPVAQIPTVTPVRTFLEKIFLLHEEFQKPEDRPIRSHRMTRHLYDLSKIIDSPFAEQAFTNKQLYFDIIKHREMLTKISWIDYSKHAPQHIDFLPPQRAVQEWKEDYHAMAESMFQGAVMPYDQLIDKLTQLKYHINNLDW